MQHPTLSHSARALALLLALPCGAATASSDPLQRAVDDVIQPLMKEHRIPGMAVGVLNNGQMRFFNYGVSSVADATPVTSDTLFEVGSVSKTFTALLGASLVAEGRIAYHTPVSRLVPELKGSAFDAITLEQAATYSAGGLPLQMPESITDEAAMQRYFQGWQPAHEAGRVRQYSNPSIGLFGYAAARGAGQPFATLMEQSLLPRLGLVSTYLKVPTAEMGRYAFGYAADDIHDKPIRVNPGMFDAEAYGIKSSSADLLRYLAAFGKSSSDPVLAKALNDVQQPRFAVGPMQQGLGWEIYPYPVSLAALQAGNANEMAMEGQPVTPAHAIEGARLINKTGSTNGFGAYLLAVPEQGLGIVLLANRKYPNPARIDTAYRILTQLGDGKQQ